MKITKRQLQRIIQEELQQVLREQVPMHQAIQQRQYDVPEENIDPTGRSQYESAPERAEAYGFQPAPDPGVEEWRAQERERIQDQWRMPFTTRGPAGPPPGYQTLYRAQPGLKESLIDELTEAVLAKFVK